MIINNLIKFRVWDKLEKRMIYPDSPGRQHYIIDLNGRFHNLQNGSGGDDYTVQRFTGLKDGAGVDIFEGDIVRWSKKVCAIKYENQKSILDFSNPIYSDEKVLQNSGPVVFGIINDHDEHAIGFGIDLGGGTIISLYGLCSVNQVVSTTYWKYDFKFELIGNIFESKHGE